MHFFLQTVGRPKKITSILPSLFSKINTVQHSLNETPVGFDCGAANLANIYYSLTIRLVKILFLGPGSELSWFELNA